VVRGGRRIDQATLAGLRATLDDEVSRVVDAARPRGVVGPTGDVDAATVEPDALDELLDTLRREETER
jgi:hypothetical protein